MAAAHPYDDGTAATASGLGPDSGAYQRLAAPLAACWLCLAHDVLAPLHLPEHPLDMAWFGLSALLPATGLAWRFELEEYNPNYVGGDANRGLPNVHQLFKRPVLRA